MAKKAIFSSTPTVLTLKIPHEAKDAFRAKCERENRNTSEVIRDLINGYLADAA